MKSLITALCFISLINAAADETEITIYALNKTGETFKGHTLSKPENTTYNFVGMRRDRDVTSILAQNRGPFHPSYSNEEHFVLYRYSNNQNTQSFYIQYFGGLTDSRLFRPSDPSDLAYTCKALALWQLYTTTHAEKTLSIKNKSISND